MSDPSGDPRYTPPPPFAPGAQPLPGQPPPPGYGYPPPGYYAYPPPGYGYPPRPRPRPQLSYGVVAVSVAGFGFLLVAIALLALPWFSVNGGLTASDVRGLLTDRGDLANSLSVAYFSWFSWLLLLISAGCAATAALPRPGLSLAFRIAGPLVAGFALVFTLGALELTDYQYADNTYYFEHLAAGFWVALIGFCCLGAGCIVGPRRRNGNSPPGPGTFPQ